MQARRFVGYNQPVDVEIDDDDTGMFHVYEMWIGMNEFDRGIFSAA